VKFGEFLRAFAKFMWLLLGGHIQLLHVHVSSRASFWRKSFFLFPAFLSGLPTVLHLHGSEFAIFFEKECGDLRKRIVQYVFNRVSRVVVLSSAWKIWVQGICTNPNVKAIYNPAMLTAGSTPWVQRKQGTVLFLGRLGTRKGTYDLLDAVAQLVVKHPQLKLLLGGDGELDQVRIRANELGISGNIELLGWLRGDEKDQYLQSAMIYALPSYNEGLPMSILEAMAAGLPIVSTPIGGIPEAVADGLEGFLVEPGDVAALANRLDRLLSEPGLAEGMGAAARRKVETSFSAEVILPQVEAVYRELGVT
jgi:glycosyltransferase involved in cell wall biosynthesis